VPLLLFLNLSSQRDSPVAYVPVHRHATIQYVSALLVAHSLHVLLGCIVSPNNILQNLTGFLIDYFPTRSIATID
jgi:hypothetical protein